MVSKMGTYSAGVLHEASRRFFGNTNLPWRSRHKLFAGNQALIQPAMMWKCPCLEFAQLSGWNRLPWGDSPEAESAVSTIAPQAAHLVGGKPFAGTPSSDLGD